jgi:hypothetical protein
MKVHLKIEQDKVHVDETFTGGNAEEVVGKMKARVTRELPFAMRLVVSAMSNLMFAQEVVKRYNEAQQKNVPLPKTCAEFLQHAQEQGLAKIEEI